MVLCATTTICIIYHLLPPSRLPRLHTLRLRHPLRLQCALLVHDPMFNQTLWDPCPQAPLRRQTHIQYSMSHDVLVNCVMTTKMQVLIVSSPAFCIAPYGGGWNHPLSTRRCGYNPFGIMLLSNKIWKYLKMLSEMRRLIQTNICTPIAILLS